MVIFIHTIMCRDRQTDIQDEKQYNQYSSQKARSRKTSQTDAIKYPRDCEKRRRRSCRFRRIKCGSCMHRPVLIVNETECWRY